MQMRFREVFEPFKACRLRGRLTGPVAPGARCGRCSGPCRPDTTICRGCAQIEAQRLCEAVVDYFNALAGYEPDFAPKLIDRIYALEKKLGPAAFWPREETVH